MTMNLIETKTLSTATASITFTNIPQDATDLILHVNMRSTRAAVSNDIGFRLNNDSGSNYTFRTLFSTGSGIISTNSSSTRGYLGSVPGTSATNNTFGNGQFYIPNYTASIVKIMSSDFVMENNDGENYSFFVSNSYSQTSAITSISVFTTTGDNLAANSSISLYKITKA